MILSSSMKEAGVVIQERDRSYFHNLLKNSKTTKKQVALYLDDGKIERIDMISRVFSSISDTKGFSRNTLIEMAIDKFLNDAEEYLQETEGIDVDALIEEARSEKFDFDTVILSSKGRGFEETFLGEKESPCWYPCKISEARENHLKYIAIYRGQPVSAITHYAKIKEFHYDPERECKVCYFDGEPIELEHKVTLGSRDGCYFIGAKYTLLSSLENATKADEIVFG